MPVPKNFSTPVRMSAKERVLSQIQRWIIDGTLQPGEKLVDAELAESLAVSRTPIREAFQLLEVQGLVSMYPGKETRVREIEKDDVLKMYPALASLHALAAEQAALVIGPAQLEQLKQINAQFREAIENKHPYLAMEQDELFHNLIVEAADNPYVASFSATLQIHIRRFKYVFLQKPGTTTVASAAEHASLIEAMERHDSASAHAIMKQNIIRPMHELNEFITAKERMEHP